MTSETVTEDMKLEASILGQGNDLDGMSRVTLDGVRENEFHEFHFDGRALSNDFWWISVRRPNVTMRSVCNFLFRNSIIH